MNEPEFFTVHEDQVDGRDGTPWAEAFYPPEPERGRRVCSTCGQDMLKPFSRGPATAQVIKGKEWADFFSGDSAHGGLFMVSERVVAGLRQAGATGFEPYPIEFTRIKPKKLLRGPVPTYYWLRISGQTDFDFSLSDGQATVLCPECYRVKMPFYPDRNFPLRPLAGTWDGSDLFCMRNRYKGNIFCTKRVLLLAREQRWTNVQFRPMDALDRDISAHSSWGIDYLGEQWPPERWYPPKPSHGKTLEQWLEWVEYGEYVRNALLDFGDRAVPPLLAMLRDPRPQVRSNAAGILSYFGSHGGIELDAEVRRLIDRVRSSS